jgi:hypothetical protein
MIALLLTRWRFGLSIAAALAVLGLVGALSHYRHAYHAEKALRQADRAAYTAAQSIAAERAQHALDATEAAYRSKANEADQSFKLQMADVRGAADRYIAAHRVRGQAVGGSPGGSVASSSGGGASVPDAVPADSNVAISDADLQACTAVTAYGIAAHNWAAGLKIGQ